MFLDERADFFKLRILAARDFFPTEDPAGGDVCFTALGDGVAEAGKVLHHALGFGSDEGVVRVSAADDRRKAGVNVVPGGRAHGRGLEAAGEAHALVSELVDVWCVGLTSVASQVAKGAVVGDDEDDVGLRGSGDGEEEK